MGLGLAVAAVAATGVLAYGEGQKEAEVLRVRRIEFVDEKGKVRMEVGVLPEDPMSGGRPRTGLVIHSETGVLTSASLIVSGEGATPAVSLSLSDGPEVDRIRMWVDPGRNSCLLIRGEGNSEVFVRSGAGSPTIRIKGSEGVEMFKVPK